MATILVRTVIIYLVISVSLRFMGKRQIGEFEVGELVCTLLISEVAAIPITDSSIPILYAIVPLLFILSVEVISSALKNKSQAIKRAIEGKPSYIIYKGRLIQNSLKENRMSIDEILAELRIQGIGAISDIEYAILEDNGKLSVIKRGDVLSHAIIIDKEINNEELSYMGLSQRWLEDRLAELNTDISEVFLMTVDDNMKIEVIKCEA